MFTRRKFLAASPAVLAFLSSVPELLAQQGGAANAPALKPPTTGFSTRIRGFAEMKPASITTASATSAKILQVTDLHFFRETPDHDQRTLDDCRRFIDRHRPDLVVVSGDLWHDQRGGSGEAGLEKALSNFATWGVPWTMVWGNHDLLADYQTGHDAFESADRCAYRGGGTHGDYRIEIRRHGAAESDPPALDLFFLNSSLKGLTPFQGQSLLEMGKLVAARPGAAAIASLAFFHIPIAEYESLIRPDNFVGSKLDLVKVPPVEGLYASLTSLPKIKASFCGHRHCNDYMVRTREMDLHFGRSTGYAGYGGDRMRKGAKMIEIDLSSGKVEAKSVFADGSSAVS